MSNERGGGGGSGVELDPSWPGLNPPANEMRVDPEELLAFATTLERQVEFLTTDAAGTPVKLRSAGSPPGGTDPFGRWQTAADMQYGLTTARDTVAWYYEQLVEQMRRAAALARATAKKHQDTDQSNQAGFDSQRADLGTSGPPVQVV